MKFFRNVVIGFAGVAIVLVGLGFGSAMFTRNQTGMLAMTLDNINPLVKTETVYASTNVQPAKHFKGGAGEDEYTYIVNTIDANGKTRKVSFNAQWRLKPGKYLAIQAKGQNVESWSAVATSAIPTGASQVTK